MSIKVERPREVGDIRALIRKRRREIASLEAALAVKGLPAHTRSVLRQNLKGSKNNLQSWEDYLSKKGSKR